MLFSSGNKLFCIIILLLCKTALKKLILGALRNVEIMKFIFLHEY